MNGYAEIDGVLMPWAERRGLHVYVGHRQNVVRSITIYVWMGPRHESTGHVWIDPINEMALIGIHAAAGNFRFDQNSASTHVPCCASVYTSNCVDSL